MVYVFVYGSLKKNHYNNHYLSNSEYIGEYTTKQHAYNMVCLGYYPAVVSGNFKISGEVYKVNNETLEYLDLLEEHPTFYKRKIIELNGLKTPVFIYLFPDEKLKKYRYSNDYIVQSGRVLSWHGENIQQPDEEDEVDELE